MTEIVEEDGNKYMITGKIMHLDRDSCLESKKCIQFFAWFDMFL